MNARDELALILVNSQRARYFLPPRTTTEHCSTSCWAEVDAILAAGFRKPKQVTTAEELDALPVDSVLTDRVGDIYERVENPDSERPVWRVPGIRGYLVTASILFPATVLYEPEPQP